MSKHSIAGAALLALSLLTATASAQYTGPGTRSEAALPVARTVAEVLKNTVDDQKVELTGTLVRQINRDTFLFRDATGEIEVEIDDDEFPAGQPVDANTRVLIRGEVDARVLRKPEIDVDSLHVLPAGG